MATRADSDLPAQYLKAQDRILAAVQSLNETGVLPTQIEIARHIGWAATTLRNRIRGLRYPGSGLWEMPDGRFSASEVLGCYPSWRCQLCHEWLEPVEVVKQRQSWNRPWNRPMQAPAPWSCRALAIGDGSNFCSRRCLTDWLRALPPNYG